MLSSFPINKNSRNGHRKAEAYTPPMVDKKTYVITQTLTNVESTIAAETVEEGKSVSGYLTAAALYEISSVEITMGDVDITETAYDSTSGKVEIDSVDGDISISASAAALTGSIKMTADFDIDNLSAQYTYIDANGHSKYGSMRGTAVTARAGSEVCMQFSVEATGTISVYLGTATGTPLFSGNDVILVTFETPPDKDFNGNITFATDPNDWKKITMVLGGDLSGMSESDFEIEEP